MADAIFISYRRDDSEGEAGRLFDDLTRAFGSDAVFMDVAAIKPGVDFRRAIEDNVAGCGVLLAVVGRTWATITNQDGKRRIEDPGDFVALEIASALKREVPVIPVLVHDAKMPAVDLLPESLKSFAYHNSVELSHTRWSSDVALLIEALKAYVTPRPSATVNTTVNDPVNATVNESVNATVHATVPVQLPAPHHPSGIALPVAAKSKTGRIAGIASAALLVLAAIVYFATRHAPNPAPISAPAPQTAVPDTAPAAAPATAPDTAPATAPNTAPAAAPAPVPTAAPAAPSPATSAPALHRAITAARTQDAPANPAPPAQAAAGYYGTWTRTGSSRAADALGKLIISSSGSGITVHAFGGCSAPACDWGTRPGVISGSHLVATFSPPPSGSDTARTATITAHPVPGGLDVFVHNEFQNPAGLRTSNARRILAPAN